MKCGGLMMPNNKNIYDAFLTTREKRQGEIDDEHQRVPGII